MQVVFLLNFIAIYQTNIQCKLIMACLITSWIMIRYLIFPFKFLWVWCNWTHHFDMPTHVFRSTILCWFEVIALGPLFFVLSNAGNVHSFIIILRAKLCLRVLIVFLYDFACFIQCIISGWTSITLGLDSCPTLQPYYYNAKIMNFPLNFFRKFEGSSCAHYESAWLKISL